MASSSSFPAISSDASHSTGTITTYSPPSSPEGNALGIQGMSSRLRVNSNVLVELGIVHPNAPSTTGVDLTEFQLFPKLPVELRLQIWRATLPGPRVIALHVWYNSLQILRLSMPPTPCALYTNIESREEALKSYELCFESSRDDYTVKKIYVNFEEDIFWIEATGWGGSTGIFEIPTISSNAAADSARAPIRSLKQFITIESGKDLDKLKRLVISQRNFSDQFQDRGKEPAPLFGLPASLEELLVTDKHYGLLLRMINTYRGTRRLWLENEEEIGNGTAKSERDAQVWKESKKDITRLFEKAKQENPDWKAPSLRFCRVGKAQGNE